ncbi:hypothetical protein B7R22_13025 [Subtercola boreus]|uniref:Nucleotidyl transferase AbiEii/AbiGii toxin family protein n=1 Tax=Subtercola boreus TaxID=120213 RepID=A0A3E0VVF5_9MICO|nr:nucleotidyl transferase AbiEii/AbiGii toxin family protein [Subtercola boreus]RFA13575.1 hypothetical protein B7R22_13025 [Subtercola boreus]
MIQVLPGYSDGNAVRSAIKSAARMAAQDLNPSVGTLVQQATYDRFLCRVFSDPNSTFLLKGGTGMLARVAHARSTRDVDLASIDTETEAAVADLITLSRIDLGDHFRFAFAGRRTQIGGENQPYTAGTNLTFDVYIGVTKHGNLSIDLAAGHTPTGRVERRAPANRLPLPRLRSHDYLLYPIADQIADKACATLTSYGVAGKAPSREKDLVDLVTIALHEQIDAHALHQALATEMILRRLDPPVEFRIPASWGPAYARLARQIMFLMNYRTVEDALSLAKSLLDPILSGTVEHGVWDPSILRWTRRS